MLRKAKLTNEQRISAVEEYLKGKSGSTIIAKKYGIHRSTLMEYVRRAKSEGIDCLRVSSKNKKYSKATKAAAVEDYLAGKGSQSEICEKYKITKKSTLQEWIKCYNSGKDFKEHSRSERGVTMKKGKKTTLEERTEIVAFCIANGKDYALTTEKYGVSYQQIYAWVRKYEAKGAEGLADRRGKAKPKEELNEADKLRMENKLLQAKIKDMEMENALLKKLRELRGGGR